MRHPRALVVDDEPDIRELLAITLGRMNIDVETAGDYSSAVKRLGSEVYDLVLTDMRLPDGDGLDLLEWIQEHRPGVPVAVITAHGNIEAAVRALKLGAFDFLSKPLDLGGGWRAVIAGLDTVSVETGERVADGQALGSAARAGEVYFELRRDDRTVDPELYL